MRFDIVTLFPEMFEAVTRSGITARALERQIYQLHCWNPRDFAANAYRTIDDRPYGGGPGMVMMAEPLALALDAAKAAAQVAGVASRVVYLSPQGKRLTHAKVMQLQQAPGLTLLCGRYEGVDQRLLDARVDEELSIGDYVLSGGELGAMVLLDAIVRQLPGVLGDGDSVVQDSFAAGRAGLLDSPHYTRPEVWQGVPVPAVLLSGHHAQIEKWRLEVAFKATVAKRSDLLDGTVLSRTLTKDEQKWLAEVQRLGQLK